MHKARAFFFVCAGLLCLATAYHLGARSAGAQLGGGTIAAAQCTSWDIQSVYSRATVACVNRTVYFYADNNPQGLRTYPGVPGTDPVVAVGLAAYNMMAMLSNGDTYSTSLNGDGTWEFVCNTVGGTPTPTVSQSTWGQLKAKYATPAPAVKR